MPGKLFTCFSHRAFPVVPRCLTYIKVCGLCQHKWSLLSTLYWHQTDVSPKPFFFLNKCIRRQEKQYMQTNSKQQTHINFLKHIYFWSTCSVTNKIKTISNIWFFNNDDPKQWKLYKWHGLLHKQGHFLKNEMTLTSALSKTYRFNQF